MFCPKCRAEYREGYTECAECRIPLVESLPEIIEEEPEEYVAVVTTNELPELAVIKSILEAAEIPYFTQGEEVLGIFPGLPEGRHSTPSGGLVSVHVPVDRAEEAVDLLRHLESDTSDNEDDNNNSDYEGDW